MNSNFEHIISHDSRFFMAQKPSSLPIPIHKTVPSISETISNIRPSTSRKSASQHPKTYSTIEDLFKTFAEKPKRKCLLHITEKSESPPRLSHQPKIA